METVQFVGQTHFSYSGTDLESRKLYSPRMFLCAQDISPLLVPWKFHNDPLRQELLTMLQRHA